MVAASRVAHEMCSSRPEVAASIRDLQEAGLDVVLNSRLTDLIRGSSPAVRESLGERLAQPRCSPGSKYWLQIPCWLWQQYGRAPAATRDPQALTDILWSQDCLHLAVCIRDDLFDGQASGGAVRQEANAILAESEGTLVRRFGAGCRIHAMFRQSFETTRCAILEVDALQRRPEGMPPESLEAYARVAEVLKLGSLAVLECLSRADLAPAVGRFCDHLAIAGQIVDDLEDLEEDLERGRLNYAASRLLETEARQGSTTVEIRDALARALRWGVGTAHLIAEIRRRLEEAGSEGASLRLSPCRPFLAQLGEQADQLEVELHRARVREAFG